MNLSVYADFCIVECILDPSEDRLDSVRSKLALVLAGRVQGHQSLTFDLEGRKKSCMQLIT